MKRIILIMLCLILVFPALSSCQSEIGDDQQNAATESGDEPTGETVSVVRLKKDVKKYGQLKRSDMEVVEVSAASVSDSVVKEMLDVVSYYATRDLFAGDYLYESQVSKTQIVEGAKESLRQNLLKSKEDFVVVSDYIKPNTGEDVQGAIQVLINLNPGRTIYFPDGEYLISSSLITRSEGPMSTTFFFSDNAVLKAAPNWRNLNGHYALICLGQLKPDGTHVNDSTSNGSYFGVFGGILDGSNLAQGISIDSSRETVIYGTCIKNPTTGIVIKHGANGGPSDADIENVDIIGNGLKDSKGIAIYGTDNTITNVKMFDMETGVYSVAPGNAFRSVDIYFSEGYKNYKNTVGFHQAEFVDFFYDCYVENAAVAYKLSNGHGYILDSVSAGWTYAAPKQTAFNFFQGFYSYMSNCRVDFFGSGVNSALIDTGKAGGNGKIDAPVFNASLETRKEYEKYLTNRGIVDLSKVEG